MTEALQHIVYTIRRFKTSSVLIIIGLLAAFVVCYMLLTQVAFQATYNHGIKDHERIYRMECAHLESQQDQWGSACYHFMAEALAEMPQVEGVTLTFYAWSPNMFKSKLGDKDIDFPFTYCNDTGLTNLTDQVIDGSLEWTDADRDQVILPASIAQQYFGTTHAAGKKMLIFNKDSIEPVTVKGVFKDFPENSTPGNYVMFNIEEHNNGNMAYTCLVKFKEDVDDVNSISDTLVMHFESFLLRQSGEDSDLSGEWIEYLRGFKYRFIPLDDVYFSNIDLSDQGNRNALGIIELLILLILIITTINTLNYTLAMSPMWVRDINTRIVVGASRSSIRLRLIAETVIISVVACLLALALCQALSMLPAVNKLFDGNIALSAHPGITLAMLAIAIGIGILSGIYPALFVTSFQTATAIKGRFGLTTKGIGLRTMLIGLQLVITMFLVSFICTLNQQTRFIFNSDYGFDFEQLVHVELVPRHTDYREQLRDELVRLPEVENVSYSRFVIATTDIYMSYFHRETSKDSTKMIHLFVFPVDHHYFSTLGIDLVKGREFEPADELDECLIVNESLNDIISNGEMSTSIISEHKADIVGVCKNIRYSTMRADKNTPIAFVHDKDNKFCWTANIRLAPGADNDAAKHSIAQLIKKHSGYEPEPIIDMKTSLEESYSNEFRFVKQVNLFSIASIIIMLVGVFCLTMLETEYRRKEIAIRKVAGATSRSIIGMLCKRYCRLILVCFVIATPIAYYIGNLWLNTFVEHQPVSWWPFPIGLLVVGSLTLGTIVLQCWHTAHENPTDSIRDE